MTPWAISSWRTSCPLIFARLRSALAEYSLNATDDALQQVQAERDLFESRVMLMSNMGSVDDESMERLETPVEQLLTTVETALAENPQADSDSLRQLVSTQVATFNSLDEQFGAILAAAKHLGHGVAQST